MVAAQMSNLWKAR